MSAAPQLQELRPTPRQEVFHACDADIAIFGGAAGGGKTRGILMEAARWQHVPGYAGVIFRREATQITGSGGLWEAAGELYPLFGATSKESPVLQWKFMTGATLAFRHLQLEKHKLAHQGREYAFIGFDELTHFTSGQFWYLISRLRSTCGVRPYCRASCNPDPDSWVREFIDWWIGPDGYAIPERSGVIRWFVRQDDQIVWADTRGELVERFPDEEPTSFTFILSKLSDNQPLMDADPSYRARLKSLPRVERMRLLGGGAEDRGGNWDVRPSAGLYFQRAWFTELGPDDPAPYRILKTVRFWDKAATEPHEGNPDPSWTRGAKVSLMVGNRLLIEHMVGLRKSPGQVEAAIKRTAIADGPEVQVSIWQDPGQAGVADMDRFKDVLAGHVFRPVRAALNKEQYAEVWSAMAEPAGGSKGRIWIRLPPKGGHEGDGRTVAPANWVPGFYAEIEAFPEGKNDQVDAVSGAVQVLVTHISRYTAGVEAMMEDMR